MIQYRKIRDQIMAGSPVQIFRMIYEQSLFVDVRVEAVPWSWCRCRGPGAVVLVPVPWCCCRCRGPGGTDVEEP